MPPAFFVAKFRPRPRGCNRGRAVQIRKFCGFAPARVGVALSGNIALMSVRVSPAPAWVWLSTCWGIISLAAVSPAPAWVYRFVHVWTKRFPRFARARVWLARVQRHDVQSAPPTSRARGGRKAFLPFSIICPLPARVGVPSCRIVPGKKAAPIPRARVGVASFSVPNV